MQSINNEANLTYEPFTGKSYILQGIGISMGRIANKIVPEKKEQNGKMFSYQLLKESFILVKHLTEIKKEFNQEFTKKARGILRY